MLEYIYSAVHKVQGDRSNFTLDEKGKVYEEGVRISLPRKVKAVATSILYCVIIDEEGGLWLNDRRDRYGFRHLIFPHKAAAVAVNILTFYVITSNGLLYSSKDGYFSFIATPEPMLSVVCCGTVYLLSKTAALHRIPETDGQVESCTTPIAIREIIMVEGVIYLTLMEDDLYTCEDGINFRRNTADIPPPLILKSRHLQCCSLQ